MSDTLGTAVRARQNDSSSERAYPAITREPPVVYHCIIAVLTLDVKNMYGSKPFPWLQQGGWRSTFLAPPRSSALSGGTSITANRASIAERVKRTAGATL